jgi:hypothetical protein
MTTLHNDTTRGAGVTDTNRTTFDDRFVFSFYTRSADI